MSQTAPENFLHGHDPETLDFLRAVAPTVDSTMVYRVVVDIASDCLAKVYLEMYGSRSGLKVLTGLDKGIEVQLVDQPSRSRVRARKPLK